MVEGREASSSHLFCRERETGGETERETEIDKERESKMSKQEVW